MKSWSKKCKQVIHDSVYFRYNLGYLYYYYIYIYLFFIICLHNPHHVVLYMNMQHFDSGERSIQILKSKSTDPTLWKYFYYEWDFPESKSNLKVKVAPRFISQKSKTTHSAEKNNTCQSFLTKILWGFFTSAELCCILLYSI